jgi:predicted Zn-dependent peptidase
VVELISREIRRLRANGVGRHELERAKNQMKGSLMLSLESSHSRMSKLAKDELSHGHRISLEEMLADIDRISGDQVLRVSREVFDSSCLSVTALGPVSTKSLEAAVS